MRTQHFRFQAAVWQLRAVVFPLFGVLLFLTPDTAFAGADLLTVAFCGAWVVAVRRIKPPAWLESLGVSGCGYLGIPDVPVALAAAFTFGLCHLALFGVRALPGVGAVTLTLLLVHNPSMQPVAAVTAGSAALLGAGVFGVAWMAYGRQTTMWRRLTRARSRIERLSRYVPLRFLSTRLDEDSPRCVMERVWLVAVFVDLSGFTSATVRCGLADVEILVQSFVVQITTEARRLGGVVMKLMGDGALVVFPVTDRVGRMEAVEAAITLAKSMAGRTFVCGSSERMELSVRAGIASGECALGDWGADDVLDYSVIGLPINMAARLQSSAGERSILICPETAMHAATEVSQARRVSLWLNGIGPVRAARLGGVLK